MSTNTQTAFTGFQEAAVATLPQMACIGYVETVGEGKLSESGNYVVQPITIRATGPGRGVTHRILYRPEWLEAQFDPNSLTEYGDEGRKMLSVYRRNINGKGSVSALKGLAGSEEGFTALAQAVIGASDKTIPGIQSVLNDFLTVRNEEVAIGYTLKQRKDKVGTDENDKPVYELANGYEVGDFFFPTPDALKKLHQRAARSQGKFLVAFDDEQ